MPAPPFAKCGCRCPTTTPSRCGAAMKAYLRGVKSVSKECEKGVGRVWCEQGVDRVRTGYVPGRDSDINPFLSIGVKHVPAWCEEGVKGM